MRENILPRNKKCDRVEKSRKLEHKISDHIDDPEEFDIQEPDRSADNETEIENGGTIHLGQRLDPLDRIERFQKLRMRKHLTYFTLSLFAIWILVGIIHFLLTGNSFLVVASSPMGGPILIIMGYYFGDALLQKHLNRGP